MSMVEAVRAVLSKYATFNGRARRAEYWWFALAVGLATLVAGIISGVLATVAPRNSVVAGITGLLFLLVYLAVLLPSLAVGIRRLHDTGKSGWWWLISFVPFGGIVLLVFTLQDGTPGPNQYGPDPKGRDAVGGFGAYPGAALPYPGAPQPSLAWGAQAFQQPWQEQPAQQPWQAQAQPLAWEPHQAPQAPQPESWAPQAWAPQETPQPWAPPASSPSPLGQPSAPEPAASDPVQSWGPPPQEAPAVPAWNPEGDMTVARSSLAQPPAAPTSPAAPVPSVPGSRVCATCGHAYVGTVCPRCGAPASN